MKKTLTINLNGSVFHIDEDAFQRLNNYLNAVDKHFPNTEDKEILRDIEARVSELFSEKLTNRNVVEIADVEEVINILGEPNLFGEANETSEEQQKNEQREKQQTTKKSARKLYRDTDKQVFGGVLAGLAAYFGFDVVWLRILLVVCVFIGFGSPILIYIIAWLIMPEAKTAAQKLEMRGEEVTVDSIKNFFESEQFRENANRVGSKFSEIFLIFVKIFIVIFGVSAAIVGFFIILGMAIGAIALILTGSWVVFNAGIIFHLIFWSSIAFLILIPAIGMFIGGLRLIKNRQNPQDMQQKRSGIFGWAMLAVWVVSLLLLITCAIQGDNLGHFERFSETVTESRNISTFNAVEIGNGIDVEFVNSDSAFVDISAQKNFIKNRVQCEVKNGVLYIKWKNRHSFLDFNSGKIHTKIGIGKLKSIVAHNGCNIVANDTIYGENLMIKLLNGCDIDICAKANEIKLDCENGCDADLNFVANVVKMKFDNGCKIDGKIKSSSIFADFSNACNADFIVNSDNLEINAEHASHIDIEGFTNKLEVHKKQTSEVNTNNLKVNND